MRLFKNLKAIILKSIITWSEMGKQTAQAKEVYSIFKKLTLLQKSPHAFGFRIVNTPCPQNSTIVSLLSPSEILKPIRDIGMDIFWNRPLQFVHFIQRIDCDLLVPCVTVKMIYRLRLSCKHPLHAEIENYRPADFLP